MIYNNKSIFRDVKDRIGYRLKSAMKKGLFSKYTTLLMLPFLLGQTSSFKIDHINVEEYKSILQKEPSIERLIEHNSKPNIVKKIRMKIQDNKKFVLTESEYVENLYKNGKVTFFEWEAYKNSRPYIKEIRELESILKIKGLAELCGAESNFDPKAVSKDNAKSICQLTERGFKGLKTTMKGDRWVLNNIFDDISSIEKINIDNYVEDLDCYPLEMLGFKEEELKNIQKRFPNITKDVVQHIMIPRYNKLKKLFPDYKVNKKKAFSDPHYNLVVSSAVHFSDWMKLSTLQLLKKESKSNGGISFRYIVRPRSHFVGKEHLRAFHDDDIKAAYNCGPTCLRKAYLKAAISGDYDVFAYTNKETRNHRKNIIKFAKAFEKLKNISVAYQTNSRL